VKLLPPHHSATPADRDYQQRLLVTTIVIACDNAL
jgi:hypothetical protein